MKLRVWKKLLLNGKEKITENNEIKRKVRKHIDQLNNSETYEKQAFGLQKGLFPWTKIIITKSDSNNSHLFSISKWTLRHQRKISSGVEEVGETLNHACIYIIVNTSGTKPISSNVQ